MNLFWPSLGAWAYFSLKASKEEKKKDAIYDRAIRDAAEEHALEQTEYDQWVKSLPTILGPSAFDVRVNTHFAEEGVIDLYAEHLERKFHLGREFVTVLQFDKDNPRRKWAIKVEVSEATFGYLHGPSNKEICQEIEEFGGKVTCLARIKQDVLTKQYEVFLDLDQPLIIDPPKEEQGTSLG
jgi:hypothetical protein